MQLFVFMSAGLLSHEENSFVLNWLGFCVTIKVLEIESY